MKKYLLISIVMMLLVTSFVQVVSADLQYSGKGKQATDLFYLPQGLVKFNMTHTGESNFIIHLLDEKGNIEGFLANEMGDFQGSMATGIIKEGYYLFDITADGNWDIKVITNISIIQTPNTLTGKGHYATDLFYLPQGLVKFNMTHTGESNFIIQLLDEKGNIEELLVDEMGDFQGSMAMGIIKEGYYLFDITADGNWRVDIDRPTSAVTITLSPSMVNLTVGETQAFTATPKDPNGNIVSVEVTWACNNTTVGIINTKGVFTAIANGSASVTANVGVISSEGATIHVGVILTLVETYLPPGATPAERKAGLIRAMDDYFDNGALTKEELLSVLDAYFA